MSAVTPIARASAHASGPPSSSNRAVAAWLFACCALVFAIVVVGGITRLTRSGLSITEWQPIFGAVPPLSPSDWQVAFDKYRATPEYAQVNRGMSLDAFKRIFWWEYAHRLLGRILGVAFLVPLLGFAVRRRIPPNHGAKLAGIFVLGTVQGALGWYMVQSGLVDDPRVSPLRLTAHLTLAFVILGALLWLALSLVFPRRHASVSPQLRSARLWASAIAALVLVLVASGGLVAGIRAGAAYNTFPLMNGALVPPEILMIDPWWKNFVWNMATVQFDHRLGALTLFVLVPLLWWKVMRCGDRPSRAVASAHALIALVLLQILVGIATLVAGVPIVLAALHQAGAVLVFAGSLNLAHALLEA
ncbi:MAG TPA: COX15/CtaA family protein [Casimicrobiaceae bacterium]|nr:COX15/CtaA family protein [Casimicrobiaceae bacterium]